MRQILFATALAVLACLSTSDAFASTELIRAGASALPSIAPFATLAAAVAAGRVPPALLGRVRANADPKAMLAELVGAFGDFKLRYDGQLNDLIASVNDLSTAAALGRLGNPNAGGAADPDYTRTFASWFRKGNGEEELGQANAIGERAIVRAAMSVGTNSDGGYLAPVEWDRQIRKAMAVASPLRNLCTVVKTTTGGYSTLLNNGAWGSGWVGETASRPQTTTASLVPITFRTGELYAQPAITQQLLEDSAINLETWLADEVSNEFARQEAIAFVSGDGTNKPYGFLTYLGTGTSLHPGGEPGSTVSGNATQVTGDGLIDVVYALGAMYRAGASWLMNSSTAAALMKLKDGQGHYLWQPSYVLGQPATLLGYPVAIEESMPNVGAGTVPIAFGNWRRFYVINDRVGTSVLRDPYTAKPFVLFYTRKRVGGGVLDPKAVRFVKVGVS